MFEARFKHWALHLKSYISDTIKRDLSTAFITGKIRKRDPQNNREGL